MIGTSVMKELSMGNSVEIFHAPNVKVYKITF